MQKSPKSFHHVASTRLRPCPQGGRRNQTSLPVPILSTPCRPDSHSRPAGAAALSHYADERTRNMEVQAHEGSNPVASQVGKSAQVCILDSVQLVTHHCIGKAVTDCLPNKTKPAQDPLKLVAKLRKRKIP